MEEGFESQKKEPWRVLEFYSGIGGMRYSLMKAGINAEVVEAFDINDTANDVYQHNFGHRPYQGNIQSLTATDLDAYKAHAWLLSPPCQPYTRQGLQRHSGDARAFSFLRILELIPQTSQPPMMLFVENVVGFESSDTHEKMIEVLAEADFVIQEFILSPIQFGVPYSRPRYFCLAKRRPRAFLNQHLNYKILQSPIPLFRLEHDSAINQTAASQDNDELVDSCEPIYRFLEFSTAAHRISRDSIDFTKEAGERNGNVVHDDHYLVPLNLIERWGSAMDIVYPDSRRCCCFTKSYYRYVKGTGSLLATVQPKMKGKASSLKDQGLRYFTPREVANLHSFPEDFDFPQHVSLKQRYALLGNSLSIAVVAPLFRYLFAEAS